MKKLYYLLFIFVLFLILIPKVEATFGDLVYEVDGISLSNDAITITGYAYIHRTQNYVTVYARDNNGVEDVNTVVMSNGGQKVAIKIVDNTSGKELIKEYECVNTPNGYNFYYQQFWKGSGVPIGTYTYFDVSTYNDADLNQCLNDAEGHTQCYYEDLDFTISFGVDELLNEFSSNSVLSFYIAAYNNSYGKYTDYNKLRIPEKISGSSDYIEITSGKNTGNVTFIGMSAFLKSMSSDTKFYGYCQGTAGSCNDSKSTYYIYDYNESNYVHGFKMQSNDVFYYDNAPRGFLKGTKGPGVYVFCVYTSGDDKRADGCKSRNSYNYCTSCEGNNNELMYTNASYLLLDGFNQLIIKVKNRKLCPVVSDPGPGDLKCNYNKTFNSTCDELTINTGKGLVDVKIEQHGYISSVLTPTKTYAGGGFSFGIMYYNTIKWSYVNGMPSSDIHAIVNTSMNNKIKSYHDYIPGINITQLRIGGKDFDSSFLVKKCSTPNDSKDYYNEELTVSCVFYIPDSVLKQNGDVEYISGEGASIANKYYTPLKFADDYEIEAKITGMNRITDRAAKEDSMVENKPWTGNWDDTFTNCSIELYPLLYKVNNEDNSKFNFIYRPIDIYNPFPNRVAGVNWYDWYAIDRNKDRLENTYADGNLQYSIELDNKTIALIKQYNSSSANGYFDWDTMNGEKSTFINEYGGRVEGGNS